MEEEIQIPRRFTVGYALAAKKQNSFIQESLISRASDRGIDLFPIDVDRSLVDQGPFDCIIHKLPGEKWKSQLEEYTSRYPDVRIVDRPELIERLQNRISMLEVVSNLDVVQEKETFGIPKQVVINDQDALSNATGALSGLRFPMIAKPLVADGSAKSHKMALVFRHGGLLKLNVPIVLQEFVNHGGVIFKVYVAGDYVNCVIRKSLPDVSEEMMECSEGLVLFSQISNVPRRDQMEEKRLEDAQMPPRSFIMDIAMGLRQATGLHLFNFDVIRDVKVGNRYLVIDINYFPGYAKMPSYEAILTDFFWDIVHKNTKNEGSDSTGNDSLKLVAKDATNLVIGVDDLADDEDDGADGSNLIPKPC